MQDLDQQFGLSETGNSEILFEWCLLSISSDYEPGLESLEKFLLRQGREKFVEPLYRALAETPEGLARARRIYAAARPGYHPVSRATVDAILAPQP
jgi:hypothetical protein